MEIYVHVFPGKYMHEDANGLYLMLELDQAQAYGFHKMFFDKFD